MTTYEQNCIHSFPAGHDQTEYRTFCFNDGSSPSSKAYIAIPYGDGGILDSVAIADLDKAGSISHISTGGESHCTDLNVKDVVKSLTEQDRPRKTIPEVYLAADLYLDRDPCNRDIRNRFDTVFEKSWLNWLFRCNAERILSYNPDTSWHEREEMYRNVFGYLFAKAIEMEYTRTRAGEKPFCIYDPVDAWAGVFRCSLDPGKQRELEYEHARGRDFFDTYKYSYCEEWENTFVPINWCAGKKTFHALVGLQHIAQAYSGDLLKW